MRLRTQFLLAFLLLAVVPLGVLVVHDYSSTLGAFREAVWAENEAMAAEIGERMIAVEGELAREVALLGRLGARRSDGGPVLERILSGVRGGVVRMIDAIEFVPAPVAGVETPTPPAPVFIDVRACELAARETSAPPPVGPPAPPAAPTPPEAPIAATVEEGLRTAGVVLSEVVRQSTRLGPELARATGEERERLEREAAQWAEELGRSIEARMAGLEERVEAAAAQQAAELQRLVRLKSELAAEELARLEAEREEAQRLLRRDFDAPVEVDGRVVGELRAQIRAAELLRAVLARSSRERGEIPFAIDTEGNLHTVDAADRERLEAIGVAGHGSPDPDQWIVAEREDPGSGLRFGIARPVGEALQEIRRTSVRNFSLGLGFVALALLGTLPLSSRMTRRLDALTREAERLADGDLEARVPVTSRDEIGRLAETFNRMASDLHVNQKRLLEQEVARSLLAAEHERKSRELEEARAFQLSLLPAELPKVAGVDLAVRMRTATEVGGDYYDAFVAEDGALVAAVGDATGHGSRAGTMVSAIKMLLCADAGVSPPAALLDQASRALRRMGLERMHMGLALLRLENRHLTYAAAGMPPLLLHRAASGEVEEVLLEGMPLGGLDGFAYEEVGIDLAPGDTVVLLSDGLVEATSVDGELFGYERVRELIVRRGSAPLGSLLDELLAEAERWSGGESLADDATFLAIRVG